MSVLSAIRAELDQAATAELQVVGIVVTAAAFRGTVAAVRMDPAREAKGSELLRERGRQPLDRPAQLLVHPDDWGQVVDDDESDGHVELVEDLEGPPVWFVFGLPVFHDT